MSLGWDLLAVSLMIREEDHRNDLFSSHHLRIQTLT